MKLKLEFEYMEAPLSAFIDEEWEEIVCVSDLDVASLFDNSEAALNSKAVLSAIPSNTWIINPVWNPRSGFFGAIRPVREFKMQGSLHVELNRLDALFQATYDDNYPPDSRFKTEQEELDFQRSVEKLEANLRSSLGLDLDLYSQK